MEETTDGVVVYAPDEQKGKIWLGGGILCCFSFIVALACFYVAIYDCVVSGGVPKPHQHCDAHVYRHTDRHSHCRLHADIHEYTNSNFHKHSHTNIHFHRHFDFYAHVTPTPYKAYVIGNVWTRPRPEVSGAPHRGVVYERAGDCAVCL